ncbi:MAG: NAD(P)/FAD-dependent oxidoreductase [Clostridia bacterium]|nr:NAD(P)/FAD-dependent oxidoreductase [Clostridia bacterium]
MKADVIVIGAGAAGMLAAGTAAERGKKVILIERNEKPGRKLMITGKGRCNLTNNRQTVDELISNVPENGRFLYGAFSKYMPCDVMDFFESRGVPLKTERGQRVFPASDRAADIVDCLSSYARGKAQIINARVKELIIEDALIKGVITYGGERVDAPAVIVATGGLSYPATGSTGDGYELAKQAGHTVVPPVPSLVPLEIHEGFCSSLSGLSLRNIAIRVTDTAKSKTVYEDFGEMLFTHFGVSGPVILSASAHMKNPEKGRYTVSIDLKPALTAEMLDARILRDFSENLNRNFINSLNSLLPKSLVPVIVKLSGIPMNLKVNQVTKEQRAALVNLLKNLTVTVTGFRPVDEAVVTRGGVNVKEINPSTMESKLVKGLFFAGEVMDVDAYTGGFNLQIAFSTGHLAGESV